MWVDNRLVRRTDGVMPFQAWHGVNYISPMVVVGEKVHFKEPELAMLPKTAPRWGTVIGVGRSEWSKEHMIMTVYGRRAPEGNLQSIRD